MLNWNENEQHKLNEQQQKSTQNGVSHAFYDGWS